MTMEPTIPVIFTLNREPEVVLVYDFEWTCESCQGHCFIDFSKFPDAGRPNMCVGCEFYRAKRDVIFVMGWNITRTKSNIVVARAGKG